VRIGGDFQGGANTGLEVQGIAKPQDYTQKTGIYNADNVAIKAGAHISASALKDGNGGTVIVWADKTTAYQGKIEAKGGAEGGDGGGVEVSGKEKLGFAGTVDTSAPQGKTGVLLLDPIDLTVSNNATQFVDEAGTTTFTSAAGGASNLNIGDLLTALDTTNVLVLTGAAGAGNGDITIQDAIDYDGTNTLNFTAYGSIIVDATVDSGGTLEFEAGDSAVFNADVTAAGNLLVTTGGTGIALANGVVLSGNIIELTMDSPTSSLTVGAGGGFTAGTVIRIFGGIGQTINLNDLAAGPAGDLNLNLDALGITSPLTEIWSSNAPINVNGATFGSGLGYLDLRSNEVTFTGINTVAGTLRAVAPTSISTSGALTSITGGNIILVTQSFDFGAIVDLITGDEVTFASSGSVNLNVNHTGAGTGAVLDLDTLAIIANTTEFWVSNGADLNISGATFGAGMGNILLTGFSSSGSNINFTGAASSAATNVTISTAGAVSLDADFTTTGDLTVTAGSVNSTSSENRLGGNDLQLALTSNTTASDFHTEVDTLRYNNTGTASMVMENHGALTIQTEATSAGAITVNTASPLIIAVSESAASISHTAGDSAGAGDNLTVNAGVNLTATAGGISLRAGDDLILNNNTLNATNGINLASNHGMADALGNALLSGAMDAGTGNVSVVSNNGSVSNNGVSVRSVSDFVINAGTGSVSLTDADNEFTNILVTAANNVTIDETDSMTAGVTATGNVFLRADNDLTISGISTNLGTSTVRLEAGDNIDQTGAITGFALVARTTTGSADLSGAVNDVSELAANVAQDFLYEDSDDVLITTVNGQAGINAVGNVLLNTGGAITQNQKIDASGLVIRGAGSATLTNGGNTISNLAVDRTGEVNVFSDTTLFVTSLLGTSGIDTGIFATTLRADTITQDEAITAVTLTAIAESEITLLDSGNDVSNLAAQVTNAGNLQFFNSTTLTVGAGNGINGLSTFDGNATLTVGGNNSLLTHSAASVINGDATLVSDRMSITSSVTAENINIRTFNAGDQIFLGVAGNASDNILRLNQAELDNLVISTATGLVTIGSATQGAITVVNAVSGNSFDNLFLHSQGEVAIDANLTVADSIRLQSQAANISHTAGAQVITDALTTQSALDTDLETQVDTLNATITAAGNLTIENTVTDPFEVVSAIIQNGNADITTDGDLIATLIQVQTGTGGVFLESVNADVLINRIITPQGGANIAIILANSGNILHTGAASVDITSGSAFLAAAGNIGLLHTALANALTATSITAGNIEIINDSDDLLVAGNTRDGFFSVTNRGNIQADNIRTGTGGAAVVDMDLNDITLVSDDGNIVLDGFLWAGAVADTRLGAVAGDLVAAYGTGGDIFLTAFGSIKQNRNFSGNRDVVDINNVNQVGDFLPIAGKTDDVVIADMLTISAGGEVLLENDRRVGETQRGNQINTLFLTTPTAAGTGTTKFVVRDSQDGMFLDGTPGGVTFNGYQVNISTRTGKLFGTREDLGATPNDDARETFWYNTAVVGENRYNLVIRTPITTVNGRTILAAAEGFDFTRIAGPIADGDDVVGNNPTAEDLANLLPRQETATPGVFFDDLVDATKVMNLGVNGDWIIYTRERVNPDGVNSPFLWNLTAAVPGPFEIPGGGAGMNFDRDQTLVDRGLAQPFETRPGFVTIGGVVYAFSTPADTETPATPGLSPEPPDLPFLPPLLEPELDPALLDTVFLDVIIDFTSLLLGIEGDESGIRLSGLDDEEQRKRAREKLERREQAQPVGLSIGPYTNSYYDDVAETFEVRLELNETQTFRL
jgi:hypothetical protein